MKIKSLEIHNILSIENASITFGDKGLILVEGFDYDTNRANGAGKSAIFNALSFALFDKIPRRITKSEILRNTAKTGCSTVAVEVAGRTYTVKRHRPSKVEYYIDNKLVDITQEEFEKAIGMNYEQFLITMYTAQDTDNKFIALNDSAKKNFIMKIMNLEFSKYKDSTVAEISKLENEDLILKSKIDNYKQTIELYKSNLYDPKDIEDKINSCNDSIDLATKEINRLSQVQEPDLSKFLEAEKKMQDKLIEINSKKVLCNLKREELSKLDNSHNVSSCPECNTDLYIVDNTISGTNDKLHAHRSSLVDQINTLELEMAKEQEIKDFISQIKSKVIEVRQEYYEAQNAISTHRNSINIESMIIKGEQEKLQKSEDVKAKTLEIINDVSTCQNRIKEITDELVILKSVENIFDTTGAPAYIMDSIIDSFNESVTEYINEIWPNASYSLQTYKQNKDKSIKAKFSESLTINGKQRSIGSLSGGEIRALSLALDFSIIDVLGSKYSLSLNPVILDEPFNGLDSVGREMVIDILSKFSENRQVWVVDHASESKALFHDIVRVEKRNGISRVV